MGRARPDEIWRAAHETLAEVDRSSRTRHSVAAIGITNQRGDGGAWDRPPGDRSTAAIVWQDRRTAALCDDLGRRPASRRSSVSAPASSSIRTSPPPSSSGCCVRVASTADADLAFGTVDSWILWSLTGGAAGGVHATDPSNASRTSCSTSTRCAGPTSCARSSACRARAPRGPAEQRALRHHRPRSRAGLDVPVSGIAGDQQAALFGQACFETGMAKNTYGTGSFVLVNLGHTHPAPVDGLLTTVAWTSGNDVTYALEGSIFVTGAAIQWLRDGLGIIETAPTPARWRPASPTRPASCSFPRSPDSARRGGTRTRAARSSGSPAARTRSPRSRRDRGDGMADRRRGRRDPGVGSARSRSCASTAAPA